MGRLYKPGESKIRPGVYRRYEKIGSGSLPGAIVGIFAIPIKAEYGVLNKVMEYGLDALTDFKKMFGTGGTTDAVEALFNGGATKVYVYRLGSGGTAASVDLTATGETGGTIATLQTKSPTKGNFNVTIKDNLNDTGLKQLLVYLDAELLETLDFAVGEDEGAALREVVNTKSNYLEAVASESYVTGVVDYAANKQLTGGTEPEVTTESYSDAFTAFEPYRFNTLVLDTCDVAVQLLAKAYIDRIYNDGALSVLAIGEPTTVSFDDRLAHAKAFNSEKVIYFGSGYKNAAGEEIDGYLSVATQAGIVCSLPCSEGCTHTVVSGAVDTLEELRNSNFEKAITGGMVLLSKNSEGQLWFDSAVNTLITPSAEQDEGWKKIRRTATRFEMFDRIDRAAEPIVGKVNCDNVGIGDVIVAALKVLDAMHKEKKIAQDFQFYEDTDFARGSDYAHFRIVAYDYDSLEKIYLRYQFRFTAE